MSSAGLCDAGFSSSCCDAGFSGSCFTWCTNRDGAARIRKRLNKLLINDACYEVGIFTFVTYLSRNPSDHAPLLLSTTTRPQNFLVSLYLDNSSWLSGIRKACAGQVRGNTMQVFSTKLKRVKDALKLWNGSMFGNIFDKVRRLKRILIWLQFVFRKMTLWKLKFANILLRQHLQMFYQLKKTSGSRKRELNGWIKETVIPDISILWPCSIDFSLLAIELRILMEIGCHLTRNR